MSLIAVLAVVVVATPSEDARDWFIRWAETRTPPCIEARFLTTSTSSDSPASTFKGVWRARFEPYPSYVIDVSRFSGLEKVTEEWMTWDPQTGEGRSFKKERGRVTGSGALWLAEPSNAGNVEFPVTHSFYTEDKRPLKRSLKAMPPIIQVLEPDGFRFAAFLHKPGSDVLQVYVMDRRRNQPIEEKRSYAKDSAFPIASRNPSLGMDIALPPGFEGMRIFCTSRVLKSENVAGYSIPVEWEAVSSLLHPGEKTTITLIDPRIDPADARPFLREWPTGSLIYDYPRGVWEWIGTNQERLRGEVIKEGALDKMLGSGISPASGTLEDKELVHETNCGANALYLSLAILNRPEPLQGILAYLGQEQVREETSLEKVGEFFRSRGVPSLAVRSGERLLELKERDVVMLHITATQKLRSGLAVQRGHFIVADSYQAATKTLRIFDPPSLPYRATLEEVLKPWTGNALIIGKSSTSILQRNRRLALSASILLLAAVSCLIAYLLLRRRSSGAPSIVKHGVPIFLLAAVISCVHRGAPAPGVTVVGSAQHDFGELKLTNENPKHTFTIRNNFDHPIKVVAVKKSCTCLSAQVEPRILPSGGIADVTVELDGVLLAGERSALTILQFDDDSVKPLSLTVKAFFKANYAVTVAPKIWTLPPGSAPGQVIKRTFRITEFIERNEFGGGETKIAVEPPGAMVESLGPFVECGWRAFGFAREAEVTLSFTVPEQTHFLDQEVRLRFRHHSVKEGVDPEPKEALSRLVVRL